MDLSPEFLDNLLVKYDEYKPEEGELMFTPEGKPVYYSHNQYESYATGFVCCDDKNLPDRANYSVFEKLIPQTKNWTKKLTLTKYNLDKISKKIEKISTLFEEE